MKPLGEFGVLSNTFYRIAKPYNGTDCNGNRRYWVYDFHKGKNGNCWIQWYDNATLDKSGKVSNVCYHSRPEYYYLTRNGRVATIDRKDKGNQRYKELLAEGFVKVGKFEQDIWGQTRRAK